MVVLSADNRLLGATVRARAHPRTPSSTAHSVLAEAKRAASMASSSVAWATSSVMELARLGKHALDARRRCGAAEELPGHLGGGHTL